MRAGGACRRAPGRDRLQRGASAGGRRAAGGGAGDARGRGAGRGLCDRHGAARALPRAGRTDEEAAPHLGGALGLAEALGLTEVFAQTLTSKSMRSRRTGSPRRASCSRGRSPWSPTTSGRRACGVQQPRRRLRVARPLRRCGRDSRRGSSSRAGSATGCGRGLPRRPDQCARPARPLGRRARARCPGRGNPGFGAPADLMAHIVEVVCWRGRVPKARAQLEGLNFGIRVMQSRSAFGVFEAMVLRDEGKPRAALESLDRALSVIEELGVMFLTTKLGSSRHWSRRGSRATGKRSTSCCAHRETAGRRPAAAPRRARASLQGPAVGRSGSLTRPQSAVSRARDAVLSRRYAAPARRAARVRRPGTRGGAVVRRRTRETFARLDARPWLERVDRRNTPAAVVGAVG